MTVATATLHELLTKNEQLMESHREAMAALCAAYGYEVSTYVPAGGQTPAKEKQDGSRNR